MISMGVRHLEFVYGFHGCDKSVAKAVLDKKSVMLSSENDYDWLGSGIYFWEEAPVRADVAAYKPLRDTYEVLKASGFWGALAP